MDKFLIEQNVGRFTGGDAAHTLGPASLPFYIPILFVGMAPWSAWIWAAWPRRDKVAAGGPPPPTPSSSTGHMHPGAGGGGSMLLSRFLASWAGVVFVFFSLSGAKLPHYVLPSIPPLAILVAVYLFRRAWALKAGIAMCALMCMLANAGFIVWYQLSGQREAHDLIRYVGRQGGDVALYQLGRRNQDRGTGRPRLQETSLPSLLMYLNRDALETDRLSDVLAHSGPVWVFTRAGRFGPADFVAARTAGRELIEVEPTVKTDNFKLYQLR